MKLVERERGKEKDGAFSRKLGFFSGMVRDGAAVKSMLCHEQKEGAVETKECKIDVTNFSKKKSRIP